MKCLMFYGAMDRDERLAKNASRRNAFSAKKCSRTVADKNDNQHQFHYFVVNEKFIDCGSSCSVFQTNCTCCFVSLFSFNKSSRISAFRVF